MFELRFDQGFFEVTKNQRPLDESEYLGLGKDRCQLDSTKRRRAYDLFNSYQNILVSKGWWNEHYRVVIMTMQVKKRLDENLHKTGLIERLYNKVYVNEVHDITQAEIALLFLA